MSLEPIIKVRNYGFGTNSQEILFLIDNGCTYWTQHQYGTYTIGEALDNYIHVRCSERNIKPPNSFDP